MALYDSQTKIWSSNNDSSIFNPKKSVGELILYTLRRTPDKICEISDDFGVTSTCDDILKRSIQVAEALKEDYGLKYGDVCSIVAKNNPEVSSVAFGCLFNGCSVNPMDVSFAQIDFDHMIGLTKPKIIFAERSVIDKIRKSITKLGLSSRIFCFTGVNGEVAEGITPVKSFYFKNLDVSVEDYRSAFIKDTSKHIALIMCSSGTTGLSKGVCLSHAQVVSQSFRSLPMKASDTTFTFSSIYWITGMITMLSSTIEGAIRIISTQNFSPEYYFKLIEKYKVTHSFITPSMIAGMLQSKATSRVDLSSLKTCYVGGSYVLEDLRASFEKYLGKDGKVIPGYGMTELGGVITFNLTGKPESVGVPLNETEVKIISDDGILLGPEEKGEICLKSPYMFLGYYNNEEALKDVFDSDGWIRTGDLGYFDAEGYLFLSGRKKELIKYKNYQISPETLETLIHEITGLTQVCAVAVEKNNLGTDFPAAVIVLPKDFKMSKKEVIKVLDEKLDDVKKLRGGVYFVENFPTTASGKVLRRAVKELANKLYQERQVDQSG
ncbi:probable 4-coumarate--CoA ligase 1 [Culicoides brevitarsis]|uniref:probable 4-coumarate--CoA ligase 1 n=1 Tax=Culicoides brevitarsis TaxID=469753 RepID=UPI00307C5066